MLHTARVSVPKSSTYTFAELTFIGLYPPTPEPYDSTHNQSVGTSHATSVWHCDRVTAGLRWRLHGTEYYPPLS